MKAKRGRPSSITVQVDRKEFNLFDGKVKQILKAKIKPFSKSGGYIPISQKYKNHDAFVIVMEGTK